MFWAFLLSEVIGGQIGKESSQEIVEVVKTILAILEEKDHLASRL